MFKKKLVKERKNLSDESINQEDFEEYYAKIYRIQFSFLERQQVTKSNLMICNAIPFLKSNNKYLFFSMSLFYFVLKNYILRSDDARVVENITNYIKKMVKKLCFN